MKQKANSGNAGWSWQNLIPHCIRSLMPKKEEPNPSLEVLNSLQRACRQGHVTPAQDGVLQQRVRMIRLTMYDLSPIKIGSNATYRNQVYFLISNFAPTQDAHEISLTGKAFLIIATIKMSSPTELIDETRPEGIVSIRIERLPLGKIRMESRLNEARILLTNRTALNLGLTSLTNFYSLRFFEVPSEQITAITELLAGKASYVSTPSGNER